MSFPMSQASGSAHPLSFKFTGHFKAAYLFFGLMPAKESLSQRRPAVGPVVEPVAGLVVGPAGSGR